MTNTKAAPKAATQHIANQDIMCDMMPFEEWEYALMPPMPEYHRDLECPGCEDPEGAPHAIDCPRR